MAKAFLNRCIWTAVSSGTGSFVVSAAAQNGYIPSGCAGPAVVDGATYHYFATNGTDHEEGDGVYTVSTTTLTRATIRNSSTGAAVSFASAPVVTMGGPISTDINNVTSLTVDLLAGSNNATINLNGRNAGVLNQAQIFADQLGDLNFTPGSNGLIHLTGVSQLTIDKGAGSSNATINLISRNSGAASPTGSVFTDQTGGFNISAGTGGVAINQWLTLGAAAISADTSVSRSAAGVVQIGTGGANASGSLKATNVTLGAGTATVAPLNLTSGTNLTTAAAGAWEFDGTVFYSSPAASSRGVSPSHYLTRQHAVYTLTSNTAVQKLFNGSTNGAVTLPLGTYFFKALFSLSSMSATSGNAAFSLAVGTAVIANVLMQTSGSDGATAAVAAESGAMAVTAATPASMVTAGVGTGLQAFVEGTFEVTTSGTVIPSIQLVTAAAAVVAVGSYFECYSVGATTVTNVGNWS